jgi:hypothetical protein
MKRLLAGAGVLAFLGLFPAAATAQFTDWSTPVNLGPVVNSVTLDSCVTISKNGLTLIFSSTRQYLPEKNNSDRDLYVSKRDSIDADWGAPQPLWMLNNKPAFDSCPALSLDEHRLYFTSNRDGGCGNIDIWVSRRQDRRDDFGWEAPVNLGCEKDGYVNTEGGDQMESFFEDEKGRVLMYFTSSRPGSEGADIYQSVMRDDDTFGPATKVTELNSPRADTSPVVRRDGLEVIFLSNRGGLPSLNFWVATRTSTEDPWSVPTHVPTLGALAQAGSASRSMAANSISPLGVREPRRLAGHMGRQTGLLALEVIPVTGLSGIERLISRPEMLEAIAGVVSTNQITTC